MADNLWAPWRMEFIADKRLQTGEGPCVFCELGEAKPNEQNLVLARQKHSYVVMNEFPYANGHLLVVPYAHEAKLGKLDDPTRLEIMQSAAQGMAVLEKALEAQGFNCGLNVGRSAGCGILDHFHFHVVPRWNGDTNFLPVIGNAKAMPEYLAETYKRLVKYF